ncbi:MAG: C40 family peptidase [Paracoccaceae bacterium]|nr:MAG: C40 family peptidase [Paracoccaceae bacterium]
MLRDAVVAEARAWVGTPYVHQSSCRGAGADCLGLVRGIWRAVLGPEPEAMPAYTPDWGEAGGCELLMDAASRFLVPVVAAGPGDVILFRMRDGAVAKHLGVLVAEAAFVHAYSGHGVVESPLSGPWARRVVARFRFPEGMR